MKIRPKSPEAIQAQIAAFAAENIERSDAKKHVFDNIGSLAVSNIGEVAYKTTSNEYVRDERGEYIRTDDGLAMIPKDTERIAATKDEYLQYLRTVGGSHHEAIAARASMLEQYKQFEPDVSRLIDELENTESRKGHPAYLGSGSNVQAYRIHRTNKDYVVRIGKQQGALSVDGRADVMTRAKGVPHLEQVVAMSYDDAAIITEFMPGRELDYNTPIENMQHVTDEQLSDLVDTVIAATERGIAIDPKPTNIFYDPKEGFGIIDLNPANSKTELGDTVGDMATSLSNTGFYAKRGHKTTLEVYEQDLAWKKVHRDLVMRYRIAVTNKLDGVALENALEVIDRQIEYARNEIGQLSNSHEVARRIVREKEFAERKAPTGSWTSI